MIMCVLLCYPVSIRTYNQQGVLFLVLSRIIFIQDTLSNHCMTFIIIKRPARDACLCMGELQAPPAPHFVFLITL